MAKETLWARFKGKEERGGPAQGPLLGLGAKLVLKSAKWKSGSKSNPEELKFFGETTVPGQAVSTVAVPFLAGRAWTPWCTLGYMKSMSSNSTPRAPRRYVL